MYATKYNISQNILNVRVAYSETSIQTVYHYGFEG